MADNETKVTTVRATQRSACWVLGVLTTAAVAGCVVLYGWNPSEVVFFPSCVFHLLTGLYCPGCGTLRGLHQLLHGNVLGALRYNLFMVALIPFVVYFLFVDPLRGLAGRKSTTMMRPIWIWILLVLVVLFWILRNIPAYPFTLLAPLG